MMGSEAQENLWKRSLEIANGQSTVEKADEDIQEITASQATKSTVNTRSANRKSTGTASVASGSTKDPPSSSKDRTRSQRLAMHTFIVLYITETTGSAIAIKEKTCILRYLKTSLCDALLVKVTLI